MDQASHPLVLEILDALTDPVILIDSRKVIVRANSAAHRAWSGLANDIPLSFTLRMPDLIEAVDQVLVQGGTVSGELIERAPVERVYHFDVTSLSQSAKRGERGIAAAILIFRDLTEAKDSTRCAPILLQMPAMNCAHRLHLSWALSKHCRALRRMIPQRSRGFLTSCARKHGAWRI